MFIGLISKKLYLCRNLGKPMYLLLIITIIQLIYVSWNVHALNKMGKPKQGIVFFLLFGLCLTLIQVGFLMRIYYHGLEQTLSFPFIILALGVLLFIPTFHLLTRAVLGFKAASWLDIAKIYAMPAIYVLTCVVGIMFPTSETFRHWLMVEALDFVCCSECFVLLFVRIVRSSMIREQIYHYYADYDDKNYRRVGRFHVIGCSVYFVLYALFILRSHFFEEHWLANLIFFAYIFLITIFMGRSSRTIQIIDCRILGRDYLTEKEIAAWQLGESSQIGLEEKGVIAELKFLEDRVLQWTASDKKPYLAPSLTIKAVSEQMRINESQLSTYLNKSLDVNFNTWINSLRVGYAKQLLDETSMNMEQIAAKCGFSDRVSLSRAFVRTVGCSVREYKSKRAQLANNPQESAL